MAMPNELFDENLQEVMKLLEQKAGAAEQLEAGADDDEMPSKEAVMRKLTEGDKDEVLVGEQAAMAEFSMMMRQWESLVEDYERREAEERAEAEAARGEDASDAR